jgi:hypothetical protein
MGEMKICSVMAFFVSSATACIGLHADEAGIHVVEFCKVDTRFQKYLLDRNDLNNERNGLRTAKFRHLANLISFVEDYKVNLILQKEVNAEINETYAKFEVNNKEDDTVAQLDLVIHVNQKGDFASAYFSTIRELVISRIFFENIHKGKIAVPDSFEEFFKIYKELHKQATNLILEDYNDFDSEWCKAEGIEADVKRWQKNELSQVHVKSKDLSDILKIRAKLFYDSYKLVFDRA